MPALRTFDDSKHPRGQHGRFADKGGAGGDAAPLDSPRGAVTIIPPERRTQAKMPAWHRTGSRIQALPIAYTGSTAPELPVGSFRIAQLQLRKPADMPPDDHKTLLGHLVSIIHGERENTIAAGQIPKRRGKLRGAVLIPPGTDKRTVKRAYNHAGMMALSTFLTTPYHFAMDDHLKAEMTPLTDFIRFSYRRLLNTMTDRQKGGWQPYRAAFGQPFKSGKTNPDGSVRLQGVSHHVMVKAWGMGAMDGSDALSRLAAAPQLPRPNANPNVLPVQQGIDRFARYRKAVAMDEAMGRKDLKILTPAQDQQRKKAGIAFRLKRQSGAPRLLPGQAGSVAGLNLNPQPGAAGTNPVSRGASLRFPGARA